MAFLHNQIRNINRGVTEIKGGIYIERRTCTRILLPGAHSLSAQKSALKTEQTNMNRDVTERIRRNIKNVVHMPAIINTR